MSSTDDHSAVNDALSDPRIKKPHRPDVLLDVASRFGTPSYVYFEDVISRQIERLQDAIAPWSIRLLYAMKANSNVDILRLIRSKNVAIDAVSPAEAELAMLVGFAPEDIFFSANNMSTDDLAWAASRNVWINVGEDATLDLVGSHAPGSEISLRVNLEVGAGHHEHVVTGGNRSKFGIVSESLDAALRRARDAGLPVVGLHQHIGSGSLDVTPLVESVKKLADLAMRLPDIRFVNIGGGLGVGYDAGQENLRLRDLMDGFGPSFSRLRERGIAIWMEPGRYVVAESGVLLVSVTDVKHRGSISFAGTNSGMNHLIRPALYGARHAVYNLTNPEGQLLTYDVVGNICESGDFLAKQSVVAEIRRDDILAVLDTGAYGVSMANEYNLRPLPAEVYVGARGARLSRDRENPAAMARRYLDANEQARASELSTRTTGAAT